MNIRAEQPADVQAIYDVVKRAFETAAHRDGNEHDLVNALRDSDAFIPELSLIAEIDGKIVGHILFTKVQIGTRPALALAPLSVLPKYQRQGIGTALIKEGHKQAAALGYGYSVVLGSETYYPRMGYVMARTYGILPPFDVPNKNFMACKLRDDAPSVSGIVRYDAAFGI